VWDVRRTRLTQLALSLARCRYCQPLQVLNDDGVVANVVHQYDRYDDVANTFHARNRFLERQSFLFNVSLTSIKVRQ
jgi:hypothetical protein